MLQILLLSLGLCAQATYAKTANSSLKVQEGIVYLPLEGVRVTAGYGTIKNTSKKTVNIKIISAKGFKAVELHETSEKDGMMKMQKVDTFEIKENDSLVLKPGGHHIMLFDPETKFKEGEVVKITFNDGQRNLNLDFKMQSRDQHKKQEDDSHHH